MKLLQGIKIQREMKILIGILLAWLTIFLIRDDSKTFLSWWLAIWVLGCAFMPLTGVLFAGFQDRGWLFSKAIAVAVSGYLTWVLVTAGGLKFTALTCMGVTFVCVAANVALAVFLKRKNRYVLPVGASDLIFLEEVILYVAFLLWTYVAGFHPEAHGVEKFMDYGFMEAMMRSTELPATDMWYGQEPMNYYYGGQYYAVFLTKLTGTQVSSTYHLMRTFVAGMAFALPFSLVRQVAADYYGKAKRFLPACSGLLAGAAVSLAGNMHYVIYGKLLPLLGKREDDYWFPNSTRYIGHDPENMDRTIHEFPSYSFILGDLHAHVVNVFFVLTVIALLYAWIKRGKYSEKKTFMQWPLLMCGVFIGIFQWTNTWDFAIYYVVICGVCFFGNLRRFQDWKRGISASVVQWAEVLILGLVVPLPFTLLFDSSMAQGVKLAQNHSAFYQFCVLWALPAVLVLFYLVKLFLERGKCKPLEWLKRTEASDLFMAVLCLCALGLIVLPEIVYVKDIYEETSARSNTMFKLTYQAFILFGISLGFILVRFLAAKSQKWLFRAVGLVGTVGVLLTVGYTGTGVVQWDGEVWKREGYRGLDCTAYLETQYPQDAAAIRWLKANVAGSPIVLEANGDSYSDYCRVSAMTGLPTILGWYTHEWLWRNDTADLNEKSAQIETIYTSTDEAQVRSLLEVYNVAYIFVGQMEREKYPNLNEEMLRSLGTAVFDDEALIIQVE